MQNAKFIVFEGLDGSGTSTQANLLERRLVSEGQRCHLTSEPSAGPVGQMIRQSFKLSTWKWASPSTVAYTVVTYAVRTSGRNRR